LNILDSDVLIEAYQTFYSFDLCPGFWDFLDQKGATRDIVSIREVRLELEPRGDDLSRWAARRQATFFLEPTNETVQAMQQVAAWTIATPNFSETAKREFLAAADSFLVAAGLAYGASVVTLEQPNQANQIGKIKIPTACAALNVACEPPFRVLQREGARFVL
jgi:hypothetical protein